MTDADIVAIGSIVYGQWADAHEALDRVQRETDDGSPDWAAFHQTRLERATTKEAETRGLHDRFLDEHRDAIRRAFFPKETR